MKRAKVLGAALVVAGAVATAGPAAAQTVGADLGLFSSYVWRGVSLTNKPVAQPDAVRDLPGRQRLDHGRRVGQHRSRQVRRPDNDISESGGVSSFNFAEFDPWAEVAFPRRQGDAHRRRTATSTPTTPA